MQKLLFRNSRYCLLLAFKRAESLFWIFCLLFVPKLLLCQQFTENLTTYTVNDGLSINNVTKLFKDKNGYLWVGTANGLNHFDGKSFTAIPQGNNEGQILGCKIISIHGLNDTTLIMGTDLGISTIDINSFETKNILINIPDGRTKQENFVVEMLPSKNGGFWIITTSDIILMNKFLASEIKIDLPDIVPGNSFNLVLPRMVELDNGNLLFMNLQNVISEVNNKIYELDRKTKSLKEVTFPFLKSSKRYSGLTRINDDLILFIEDTPTKINTFVWNENDHTSYKVPFDGIANQYFYTLVFPFNSQQIAISLIGDDFYYVLDSTHRSWQKIPKGLLINQAFIKEKLEIYTNTTFYVGDMGLNKITSNIKSPYEIFYNRTASFINWNNVSRPFFINDSTQVFTEINKQLIIYYPNSGRWDTIHQEHIFTEKGNVLKEACVLNGNDIFLSTSKGVRVYNFEKRSVSLLEGYKNKPELFDYEQFGFFNAKNGNIYIKHLRDSVIHCIDKTKKEVIKLTNPLIGKDYYLSVTEDNRGNIFYTNHRMNSILKINTNDLTFSKIYPDQKSNRLFSNVTSIDCDRNNNLWLFTNGYGIFCLDSKNYEVSVHYTKSNGLSSNYIIEKLEDRNGNFIIKTSNNIHQIDPISKIITNISSIIPPPSGIGFTEMDPDMTYFLINRNGTNMVLHADSMVAPKVKMEIDVFWAEWRNKFLKIPKNKTIYLDRNFNSITVYFRSINYKDGAENKYFYRLRPHENEWVEIINSNKINLNHIGIGQNLLDIKLCYNNGQCVEQTVLTIYIKPYIWQQWWFWALMSMIILAVLLNFLFAELDKRKIKMEKSDAEMMLLQSRLNPHFIYNALNSINRYILIFDKLNASEYLSKFAKLMRLTLDHSNKMMIPIQQELDSLRIYLELESLRFQQKIDYSIDVDPNIQLEKAEIPPMMIQPFVENAIWHGLMPKQGDCVLKIEFRKYHNDLEIIIEDNGVGRAYCKEVATPKIKSSEGIKMTEKRMEALSTITGAQGNVKILDLEDEDGIALGTRVILHFSNLLK